MTPDDFGNGLGGGVVIGMSACVACSQVFVYDPETVPSVSVRLGTGRGTGRPLETTEPGAPNSTREPICPLCAKRINVQRAALGLELIPEEDTAELLTRPLR